MSNILEVPYVGQVGEGANEHGNDCGATSASMVIRMLTSSTETIDQLYNEVKPIGDTYLHADHLMQLLAKRGIGSVWKANVPIQDLYLTLITDRLPVIALVRYGALSAIRPNKFVGSHFMVVIGMDLDNVYCHDPLNTPTSGQSIAIPIKLFEEAWSTLGEQNPQRGMIIPSRQSTVALRMVKVNDVQGLAVRSAPHTPGDKTTLLRYVVNGTRFTVYRELDGWGKVHPTKEEWICLAYTI